MRIWGEGVRSVNNRKLPRLAPPPPKKNTGHSIKPDRSRHGPDPAQDLKVVAELVLGATSHEFGKYLLLP